MTWEERILALTKNDIPAGALDGPPEPDELEVAQKLMVELRYCLAMYGHAGGGAGTGGINISIGEDGWEVTRWSREPSCGYSAEGKGTTLAEAWKDMEEHA